MNSKLQFTADKVEHLFKIFPQLPAKWRKEIAENSWWIVSIATAMFVFTTISIAFALFSVITMMGAANGTYGYYPPAGLSTRWIVLETLLLLEMGVVTVLMASSIGGLKKRSNKGWNLLFLSLLIYLIIVIVNIFIYGLGSTIWNMVCLLIGFYLIFQIKFYFRPKRKRK